MSHFTQALQLPVADELLSAIRGTALIFVILWYCASARCSRAYTSIRTRTNSSYKIGTPPTEYKYPDPLVALITPYSKGLPQACAFPQSVARVAARLPCSCSTFCVVGLAATSMDSPSYPTPFEAPSKKLIVKCLCHRLSDSSRMYMRSFSGACLQVRVPLQLFEQPWYVPVLNIAGGSIRSIYVADFQQDTENSAKDCPHRE
jgi:hypothetical protein